MTAFLDSLRARFPSARPLDEAVLVVCEAPVQGSGAAAVRWLASAGEVSRTWLSFPMPARGAAAGYDSARRDTFLRALCGLFEVRLGVGLHPEPSRDETCRLVLEGAAASLLGAIDGLEQAWRHLVVLVRDVLESDRDPFVALGARDAALERGEAASIERTAAPAPAPSAPAPATAPVPNAPAARPAAGATTRHHVALEDDGRRLVIALGVERLPPGLDIRRLRDALRANLEHRFDVLLAAAPPPGLLAGSAHVAALAGHVLAGVDAPRVCDGVVRYLERVSAFVQAGLELGSVLNLELVGTSSGAIPALTTPMPRRPETPATATPAAAAARPAPVPPAPGERVDIYLRTAGYDASRMEQVIGLLLSVNVIQARELCQAAPCLLLPDVEHARAEEIVALVARAGGRAVLARPGEVPDLGPPRGRGA